MCQLAFQGEDARAALRDGVLPLALALHEEVVRLVQLLLQLLDGDVGAAAAALQGLTLQRLHLHPHFQLQ